MTEYALVHDGETRRRIPVSELTPFQRAEFDAVPPPKHRGRTFHGAPEDFCTERPMRCGW